MYQIAGIGACYGLPQEKRNNLQGCNRAEKIQSLVHTYMQLLSNPDEVCHYPRYISSGNTCPKLQQSTKTTRRLVLATPPNVSLLHARPISLARKEQHRIDRWMVCQIAHPKVMSTEYFPHHDAVQAQVVQSDNRVVNG